MRKILFLALAIICFAGLMAVLTGGYLGVFDTLKVESGSMLEVLSTAELGREPPEFYRYTPGIQGDRIDFTYTVENREFSPFRARLEAGLWSERQAGPYTLAALDIELESFGKQEFRWTVSFAELASRGFTDGQYTLRITLGEIRRTVPLGYYYYPVKTPFPATPAAGLIK